MQKISSTSSYDAIIIKHSSNTFKSTAFQVVFSSSVLKARQKIVEKGKKLKDVQLFVNQQLIDIPLRIQQSSGRVQFQKIYTKRPGFMSDSSDVSDDDKSQRSNSKESRLSKNIKHEKVQSLKNESASFWQFAWLFNNKKKEILDPKAFLEEEDDQDNQLSKIKEEPYEGEQSSKQPLFQISLCGNLLYKKKEKQTKQQIQKIFYDNKIQYKEFLKDPNIINDSNLVVRIDDSIYTWQLGMAILTCRFAYGKELSGNLIDDLINKFKKSGWLTFLSRENIGKVDIINEPIKNNLSNSLFRSNEGTNIIKYRKTPDNLTINKMNLRYGLNRAKFVLEVGNGALEEIHMQIFLWDSNEKIIISDIDGTITKSDIMGQLRKNYIHEGVSKLFHQIYKRNYKIIYLTARAIGQYKMTRTFLQDEVVEDGTKLPQGPLFMSPDGYLKSFTREVIEKTPDILKTKILASLNEIFPRAEKPIYAGFGNRDTDNIAYRRMNIQLENIYCINQKSIIINETGKLITNYKEMLKKIDEFFPLYTKQDSSISFNKESHTKNSQDFDLDSIQVKRKLSHSEFYERSPQGSQKEISQEDIKSEEKNYEFDMQIIENQFADIKRKREQQQKKKKTQ